jgi:hypothetical protein
MALEPLIKLPNAWSGAAGRFGVHLFEGRLTVADMDRLEAIGDDWHARHPGRIVELVVIFPSSARLDDIERQRLLRLVARREKDRAASATVVLAEGMIGAMQRSMLTGINLVRRPPHPVKVFSAVPEAVNWLLPHVRSACDPNAQRLEMLSSTEEFCAGFRAR